MLLGNSAARALRRSRGSSVGSSTCARMAWDRILFDGRDDNPESQPRALSQDEGGREKEKRAKIKNWE